MSLNILMALWIRNKCHRVLVGGLTRPVQGVVILDLLTPWHVLVVVSLLEVSPVLFKGYLPLIC